MEHLDYGSRDIDMGRPPTPTLQDGLEKYMTSRYDKSENTRINDRSIVNPLVAVLGPDRGFQIVKPTQVEAWFREVCSAMNREP